VGGCGVVLCGVPRSLVSNQLGKRIVGWGGLEAHKTEGNARTGGQIRGSHTGIRKRICAMGSPVGVDPIYI